MGRISRLRTQAAVAGRALRVVLSTPQVLVYPLAASLLALVLPFALGGVLFLVDVRLVWLTLPGYLFGLAPVFGVLMVAYCYELDELFAGCSPALGSGLRRAVSRVGTVVVGSLVTSVATMFAESSGDSVPFGGVIGVTSTAAMRVLNVFIYPAVATTDGSLGETAEAIQTAAEHQWGTALVAAVGTSALGTAIFWSGMIAAIVLAVVAALGVFAVELPPLGGYTLSVVLPVVGLFTALAVHVTVDGVVRTALYRYATDGGLPPALGDDVDSLLKESP
ncbi:hypothetical protein [Halosimplex sp. TS25]|uniref:hypothetical protein n=1 Tax=Halosimplex rarum TaxID=3396619 RepID=UPI0039E9C6F2